MPRKENSLWFKDAVIYELHVKSYFDSTGNGVGDFNGLIQKLEYIKEFGVNTLYLLPFYPSPLKDDGYDVTDYYNVHQLYGDLPQFKKFLKEAHRRGLRVIIELVLNHTSDQHPWFARARKSPEGSKYRDYYVWSKTKNKYKDARVILKDFESSNWTYDEETGSYYWHRYYSHQPDLNFDIPEVRAEIYKIVDHWLKIGIDGFRLANVPFMFQREGTTCENLPEAHSFLKELRSHIDKRYSDRILLAETNLWPEDAAMYFGEGEECQMAFHYPLLPRLFMSLHTEDSYPIIDVIEQTPKAPENSQWAVFLRNHDELALEMVTEEEKDYLLKVYASDPNTKHNIGIRRRLAPMLENDRRKIELMYNLLFSLPGTPIIYYGDEIGMGDNVFLGDRNGVRTPMQWNAESNAGFSHANPQKLFLPVINDPLYRYETVNVASQENNPSSLFWWLKGLIAARKKFKALAWGDIKFIDSSNSKVLAFLRNYRSQQMIIILNLSKYSQYASLNLEEFMGNELTEVFSQNRFPGVIRKEYDITIGPYGYYWLTVEAPREKTLGNGEQKLSLLSTSISWKKYLDNFNEKSKLEKNILPSYLNTCRWFGGKAKEINKVKIEKALKLKLAEGGVRLLILEVDYKQGIPEKYFLPVSFISYEKFPMDVNSSPRSLICRMEISGKAGFLIDSIYSKDFRDYLFSAMANRHIISYDDGKLIFSKGIYAKLDIEKEGIASEVLKVEQSNTSVVYNNRFFLKFYRKLEYEINPDLEIVRFLSEKTTFNNSPTYAGGIEFIDDDGKSIVFGMMQVKVENQGEAWNMTLDALGRYFDRVDAKVDKKKKPPKFIIGWSLQFEDIPVKVGELIGKVFAERVIKLGQRTAEMHIALASNQEDENFVPESFTSNYQRSVYSSLRKLVKDRLKLLKTSMSKLSENTQILASDLLSKESDILEFFTGIYKQKLNSDKIRIHGDYHLGQVLFNGNDFIIIDFEGEPGVSFAERRLKKSPFKDVAGMMRSFHYAAFGKLLLKENYRAGDFRFHENWADQWHYYIVRLYLRAYLERLRGKAEVTETDQILINIYLMEKAIYELGYELNSRPDWVIIPLKGILYLLDQHLINKK